MKRILPNPKVMKRIIPIIAIAVVFAACNSKPETTQVPQATAPVSTMSAEDSLVLSQFRTWKAENELSDAREFLNGGEMNSTSQNAANKPASRTSSTVRRSSSGSSGTRTASSSGTSTASKKKGWSSAAKGAVIGGVAGAAGGAVINKRNRAVGAVVGGILGAGVGYGIGRNKDIKSGRTN
jgi:Glycine zipper